MKRLFLILTSVLASLGVMAATSEAANPGTGGVSIETGNSWDVFQPNPVALGGSTNITVSTFQDNPQANATVTFTGLPAGVTLTANGDTSAVCLQSATTATCTYTDYAHSQKSDNYTFTVPSGSLPTSTADCKNNGWTNFLPFKNQGDCVSFVASGGRTAPVGNTYSVGVDVNTGVGEASESVPLTIN